MFERITSVFFDIGDTLYVCPPMEEEYPRRLAALLADTRDVTLDEAETLLSQTVSRLKATGEEPTKVRAMSELGFSREQVHDAFCRVDPSEFLSRDPRVADVVHALRGSYRLGVISNFRRVHLNHILSVLGLPPHVFDCGIVSEDVVKNTKPAPEPFQRAITLSGDPPHQCLYVGDSPSKDIEPAKGLGMSTVLVRRSPNEKNLAHADAHIAEIAELPLLLPRVQIYADGIVHGRFQPPHNDHLRYILSAKSRCKFLWIGITRPNIRESSSCVEAPHRSRSDANPLTFIERVQIITEMLLDANVSRGEFACVPFPIDEADILSDFISRSTPCFTTIYDSWGRQKAERLRALGCRVIVLREAPEEEKGIKGEVVRAKIRDCGRDWEVDVPAATARAVYRLNLKDRLQSLVVHSK